MLVDTHCHLWEERLAGEVDQVVGRAVKAGVERMIVPGTSLESSRLAVELVKQYPKQVRALVGIHPEEEAAGGWLAELRKLIEVSREWVVGIGEIGMDRPSLWQASERQAKLELFSSQLELAVELSLPVVIHNRESEKEIREVMGKMERLPKGQFHCWSGSDEFLEWVLERDFYVSFGGNVTYPKNEKLREQVKRVPVKRLLLETDSPYLPPQGKRGERNEPSNVRISAQTIAWVRGMELEELAEQTSVNAERLFGL